MKGKLLIVGGGYADIPLIKEAKKMGYYVITTGNRPNDFGHKYSDEYCNEDFSNNEAIYKLARRKNIDFICPGCNDFAALSAAYTAEKLGIPGYDSFDTMTIIHHKDRFRKFCCMNDIAVPRAKAFDSVEKALEEIYNFKYPVIIKPVDLTGGKGISVAKDGDEAENSIKSAFNISKAKRIVVEEFIEGSRHGFSGFLVDGKIKFYFSDDEYYYFNQYMVSGTSAPGNVSKSIEEELCRASEKIASLLSLKDGIFHIQYIVKEEKPYIIEICRRPPGDLYIKFVEDATGINYPMYILKGFIGESCEDIPRAKPKGYYARHCIMASKNGKVENVIYDQAIKDNIIDEILWWTRGDLVNNYIIDKFGIVFLKFNSLKEMKEKSEKLQSLIKVIVK